MISPMELMGLSESSLPNKQRRETQRRALTAYMSDRGHHSTDFLNRASLALPPFEICECLPSYVRSDQQASSPSGQQYQGLHTTFRSDEHHRQGRSIESRRGSLQETDEPASIKVTYDTNGTMGCEE